MSKTCIRDLHLLKKEWITKKNDKDINNITAGSKYKAWWRCKDCQHEWQATVQNRVKGNGCPRCAGKLNIPLAEEVPYLSEEWITERNDNDIEETTTGSGYKAWWRCKDCQHEWEAEVVSRVKGRGCPRCAGKHEILLVQEAPHLSEEWSKERNDKDIGEITAGSQYKAWWRCETCKYEWQAIVQNRVRGTGCPHCAIAKRRKRGTLDQEAPYLIEEWIEEKNNKDVEEITAGSQYKAWWRCETCQHEWKATIQSRARGSGCPHCAGRFEIPLVQMAPHLSEEWSEERNDKDIGEITAGSGYQAWWKCRTCKYEWQAVVVSRIRGIGCPHCAGRFEIPLIQMAPHLVEEWSTERNDKDVEKITSGSRYKAWWRCKDCQHKWQAIVQDRVRGSGCPRCAGKHDVSPFYQDLGHTS